MECRRPVAVRDLVVRYRDVVAVKGVSFDVGRGEVLAIVGPNGAGKTSVLRVLAGITPVSGGSVTLCDKVFRSGKVWASNYVSYVPAWPMADPWARVADVMAASRYGLSRAFIGLGRDDREAVLAAAEELGVAQFMGRFFGELSSGEKKLVVIAAALARNPRVLLLDEPTTSLDVRNQGVVVGLVRRLASRGVAVVVATHELHLVTLYADKVLVLNKGSAIAYGDPGTVLRKEVLEGVYGAELLEVGGDGLKVFLPRVQR